MDSVWIKFNLENFTVWKRAFPIRVYFSCSSPITSVPIHWQSKYTRCNVSLQSGYFASALMELRLHLLFLRKARLKGSSGCWYVTDTLRYVTEVHLIHLVSVSLGNRRKAENCSCFENVIHCVSVLGTEECVLVKITKLRNTHGCHQQTHPEPLSAHLPHNFSGKSGG